MTFERLLGAGPVLLASVLAVGCLNNVGEDESDPIPVPRTGGAVPISGEVEVRIVDYPDGSHEQRYHLRMPDGRARRLNFASDPFLTPGSTIQGWARPGADGRTLEVGAFKARELPFERDREERARADRRAGVSQAQGRLRAGRSGRRREPDGRAGQGPRPSAWRRPISR